MTLEKFCDGRLVMLRGDATAYDAARAMFSNHIGAVLVAEQGELAGIVTDRDLALRAGPRLTLDRIPLREVMTPRPACVDVSTPLAQVAALMATRHIRRVVVLEGRAPRGLVSLDDLILTARASREQLRKIVRGQLSEYAPAKPSGAVRPIHIHHPSIRSAVRHAAHRAQTLHGFAQKLRHITGLPRETDALAAFEVVASNLIHRLPPDEARDFTAQLPVAVRERLNGRPYVPDRRISRSSIERDMASRLRVDPERATELVWRIGQHLSELISEGEVEGLKAQLPKSLKTILGRAA